MQFTRSLLLFVFLLTAAQMTMAQMSVTAVDPTNITHNSLTIGGTGLSQSGTNVITSKGGVFKHGGGTIDPCLLYTSDAADD